MIERLSWSIGIAAIALWAAASVAGAIGARREVGRFAALQAAAIADAAAPDQSLWSPERVKAWRETQTRTAPAAGAAALGGGAFGAGADNSPNPTS